MTQTRTPRRRSSSPVFPLVVIALVVGLIVGLALALAISRLSGEVTAVPGAAEQQADTVESADTTADLVTGRAGVRGAEQPTGLGTDYGIVHLALGDADFTPEQVTEVLYAADRVCEGFTAEVPITVLEQTIAAGSGMDLPTAHDFVALVLAVRC